MGTARNEALFLPAGETEEKDLSWFSGTDAADISADGKAVLLREAGEAGGPGGAAYLQSRRLAGRQGDRGDGGGAFSRRKVGRLHP
jgi:hypothetical protein